MVGSLEGWIKHNNDTSYFEVDFRAGIRGELLNHKSGTFS